GKGFRGSQSQRDRHSHDDDSDLLHDDLFSGAKRTWCSFLATVCLLDYVVLRRRHAASPARPEPRRRRVAGSGTAAVTLTSSRLNPPGTLRPANFRTSDPVPRPVTVYVYSVYAKSLAFTKANSGVASQKALKSLLGVWPLLILYSHNLTVY